MRIFVGNLASTITEAALRHLFEPYGLVERARIITARATGQPRGFAFVEMPNTPEAQAAIAGLKGRSLEGRLLIINEARPWEEPDRPRCQGEERGPQ